MSCAQGLHPVPLRSREAALGIEELIGRRESIRHHVDLAARFVSTGLNIRVQLEDISPTGTCIRLMSVRVLREGRLRWLDYEWFVKPVWQADLQCGFAFEERLDAEQLRRTLEFGDGGSEPAQATMRRLASAWVHGPGDY